MEAKLRLIIKRIHWFLAAKSALLALVWFFFPHWLFLTLALFFYLFPFFRGVTFAPFFFLLIFFAVVSPGNIGIAALLGIGFYLLLGIKDLLLIDRPAAYEALAFILLFLAFFCFFEIQGAAWITESSLFWSLLLGALFIFLVLSYGEYRKKYNFGRKDVLIAGIGGLLVWELTVFLFLLPVGILPSVAILFLAAISTFELIAQGLFGIPMRHDALVVFSVFFSLFVVLLSSISWRF